MYFDFKDFDMYLENIKKSSFVSPGWIAKKYNVSREAVYNWISRDIVDAIRYEGKEGKFVLIDEKFYSKINERKK